jgi:hypothetical protein
VRSLCSHNKFHERKLLFVFDPQPFWRVYPVYRICRTDVPFYFLILKKSSGKEDLHPITGHFEKISVSSFSGSRQVLFIHLSEYPSKFQISYGGYDKKLFQQQVKKGDCITISINKGDLGLVDSNDEKIRGFSLSVNNKSFLTETKSLGSLSKMNTLSLTVAIVFLTTFGVYTVNQYLQWKRI